MARTIPGPHDPAEMQRFLETYPYEAATFFVDEVVELDPEAKVVRARLDTNRDLPFARQQRTSPAHPPHLAAGELVMATGSLGCLHAWFFHGCRWDEGWGGFGSRIHRADFKALARIGPPLEMRSSEIRSRVGPRRVVLRCVFEFRQGGLVVYTGDQSAMFLKNQSLE